MIDPKIQRLLVGLGSHHGDDQLGWKLAEEVGKSVAIPVRQATVPADLLHWMDGVQELHLCDACQGHGIRAPGKLHRWEYRVQAMNLEDILPGVEMLRCSNSHQLSLGAVLSLARTLHLLPPRVVIWAIEGKCCEAGQSISDEIMLQLPALVQQLASDLTHA